MPDLTIGPADNAVHFTLHPNEVTNVSLAFRDSTVEVVTRDGAAEVWYTLDGSEPKVEGSNCYVIPAGVVGSDVRRARAGGSSKVRLLATDTVAVTVQRSA